MNFPRFIYLNFSFISLLYLHCEIWWNLSILKSFILDHDESSILSSSTYSPGHGLYSSFFVYSWDKEAHEVIGLTAVSAIKEDPIKKLKRLFNDFDFIDSTFYADQFSKKHPDTLGLHFASITDNDPIKYCKNLKSDNLDVKYRLNLTHDTNSLLFSLINFSRQFLLKNNHPENNFVISKNDSDIEYEIKQLAKFNSHLFSNTTLAFIKNNKYTDIDALIFIIGLIGDLHQPMHIGFGNNFGKNISVVYNSYGSGKLESNLFNLWEGDLVRIFQRDQYFNWNSGWTHYHNVRGTFETETGLFEKYGEKLFLYWLKKSIDILCNNVYFQDRNDYQTDKDDFPQNKYVFDDYNVHRKLFSIIRSQILLSGARTAIVINYLLSNRNSTDIAFRPQSVILSEIGDEQRNSSDTIDKSVLPVWVRNLLINIFLSLVVLSIFLYITRFYTSPPKESSKLTEKKSNFEMGLSDVKVEKRNHFS